VFAILTLYPQPTHLEYGKSLAQAQNKPSIHPLLNIPPPTSPSPSSFSTSQTSLTSLLHNPTPPPLTPPHQTRNSSSIPKKRKNYPRRTSCITVAARSGYYYYFGGIQLRARFSPFAALLSQSIYIYFLVEPCRFFFVLFFWQRVLGC